MNDIDSLEEWEALNENLKHQEWPIRQMRKPVTIIKSMQNLPKTKPE